jgi:ferredoxin-type protein NapF
MKVRAGHIRYGFFALALLTAIPGPIFFLTGILLWFSPFVLLNSVLAIKSVVLLNLLGVAGLVFIVHKDKGICRYVCPLGVVCDAASKVRPQKGGYKNIRHFNKYLALIALTLAILGIPILIVTDPFNLFQLSLELARTGFHTASLIKLLVLVVIILVNIWLPNVWCSRICPLGGLQQIITDIKRFFRRPKTSFEGYLNVNRRLFLSGLVGLISGLLFQKFIKGPKAAIIRPPASLKEKDFNFTCARCGNCSSACPTKIIHPNIDFTQPERLLTPEISMSDSYCLPECTSCGDVCPSGSISKFSVGEKSKLLMASVRIDVDNCILQQNKECDLCKYHCAYQAIDIRRGGMDQLALPKLEKSRCVGCGACKIVCPVQVIEIIPLLA